MADQVIERADLRKIENYLGAISGRLDSVDSNVETVNDNVKIVYDDLAALAKEFKEYVGEARRQHNMEMAETRLVKIRQELETKYGHYGEIRRTMTGILQADDLGIVKKETITNVTEEMMLTAPGYWLAPCLVAMAAWINDQREIAEMALREAIKRDDEKTSLLLALVCRRAGRKKSCLKWTKRYLQAQDEENLDRKCIIMLDAFASGLLGADSEGIVESQINSWLDHLESKPGFIEQQRTQWADAINGKRVPVDVSEYTYLKKYSKTWPVLEDIMEGATLHGEIYNYLTHIFEQKVSTDNIKVQLDGIVTSLVTDFDDEELPLRMSEKLNQFIIDFQGDIDRANSSMQVEKTAFETHNDFTQLLTDAAMKPESSHASVSTQKFALALSKDWVYEAYQDVVAANRMKIPHEIEINVDTFNDKTTDGENEEELIDRFVKLVEKEKADALAQIVLTTFDKFSLFGGIAVAVLALISLIGNPVMGVVLAIVGVGMVLHYFSRKKTVEQQRQNIIGQFKQKRENGIKIIRATVAEVVDFRIEFADRDQESEKVLDFLETLNADQYVNKIPEENRKIKVNM